ncbi:Uncharacterized protein APZ42_025583 [Daphnia magna]|uniref:DUF5641 domain-containing protein n=1 Tax=Daphnia magna TaxID=35525 RepID=A0A164SXP2_9CRUS|nr:Uncharacterized protein APZ42_025583 [Daphnia magna]
MMEAVARVLCAVAVVCGCGGCGGKGTIIPRVGEIFLLKEPNIKRVSWPTAIVTGVIHGTDAKVQAVVLRLRLGKETTRSIQTVYPLEVQANIDTPADDTGIGTVEKTTSTRKKNPLRKKNLESREDAGDSGGEDVADCQSPPEERDSKFGRAAARGDAKQSLLGGRYRQ